MTYEYPCVKSEGPLSGKHSCRLLAQSRTACMQLCGRCACSPDELHAACDMDRPTSLAGFAALAAAGDLHCDTMPKVVDNVGSLARVD